MGRIAGRLAGACSALALALALAVLACLTAGMPAAYAEDAPTVLAFTSDVHNGSDNATATRLDAWIDSVVEEYGHIDVMGFCGDMASVENTSESQFWTYAQAVMDVVAGKGVDAVYTTGNHEFYPGGFAMTTNPVSDAYTIDAEGRVGENYLIYCLGTEDWQNMQSYYTPGQVAKLRAYLERAGTDGPIIVMTHYPLHYLRITDKSSRTTYNADLVIDALNEAVSDGKKIVFLWGHNHSQGDPRYDQVFCPGDSLEYRRGRSKDIDFYYAAAGCMCDAEFAGEGSVLGKGLVITIDADDNLAFAYRDASGANVTEPYGQIFGEPAPVAAEGISVSRDRLGLEAGRAGILSVAFTPANTTRRVVTWTSSDESVAMPCPRGSGGGAVTGTSVLVRGIAPGTATITATSGDGGFQAACEATVSEGTGERLVAITIGDKAMSCRASSDAATNEMGFEYRGLASVPYAAGDSAPQDILWSLEPAGTEDGYYIRSHDGRYLSATYEANSNGAYSGALALGETRDVWLVEGGADTWELSGSLVRSANASVNPRDNRKMYLAVTTGDGGTDFFTVRSYGNARASQAVEARHLHELGPWRVASKTATRLVETRACTGCDLGERRTTTTTVKNTDWERVWGATAPVTMQKIAAKFGRAGSAVVTTDSTYKDALAASALAGKCNGLVLMTKKGSLTPQTKAALKASGVKTVYIVGSKANVSATVEKQLKSGTGVAKVVRVAATTPSQRAVAAAKVGGKKSDTVIIAMQNGFQDALSIAPYSYATKSPILYAETNKKLSSATLGYIKSAKFKKAIVVGGPIALPASVDAQLKGAGVTSITRLAGANAYRTSELIARWTMGKLGNGNHDRYKGAYITYVRFQPAVKMRVDKLAVSTGQNWLDALSGAALCGKNRSVMLLADTKGGNHYSNAANFLKANKPNIPNAYVLGGTSVVSAATEKALVDSTKTTRQTVVVEQVTVTPAYTAGG
ncbi:MAG: cell wall-binding repeat-containing protein [Coriobacteriales bacterium]